MVKEFKEVEDEELHTVTLDKNSKFKLELWGSHQGFGIIINGDNATDDFGTKEIARRCYEVAALIAKELTTKGYRINVPKALSNESLDTFLAMDIGANEKVAYYERPPWYDSEVATYNTQLLRLRSDLDSICSRQKSALEGVCDEKLVRESQITPAMLQRKSRSKL